MSSKVDHLKLFTKRNKKKKNEKKWRKPVGLMGHH